MKKITCLILIVTAISVGQIMAQCTTVIDPTPASGSTSNAVSFLGLSTNVATTYNFNGGVLPAGWTASPYTIGKPCSVNTPDNSNYFWATTRDVNGYRFVQTNALNVSYGGSISFLLRLANEVSPCEQPDETVEGVYLQYSTDGTNWVQVNYWQPKLLPSYILWTSYDFDIPVAAQTTSTRFRWIQFSSSGDTWDNWGLDDVTISAIDAVNSYTWNIAGSAYTTQTANHTFPGYGSYSVSLATTTNGGCSDTESITYVVNSVPTLNAIANQGTYVAAGSQNVALSGISDGGWGNKTLSVTATSSNTSVVPNPVITYTSANTTGTLTYTPSTNGTAVITVTVSYFNVQTVTFSRTFTITVNAPPANPTSVSVTNSTICSGGSTQLTANGAVGTVYWYTGSCGGTQVTTGNPVTVMPSVTTTYYARNFNNSQFSSGCASAAVTVNAIPASGTLTPTPAAGAICSGTSVSATATPGSGGTGTIGDVLQYRYDGGSWLTYTSGTSLTTTGHTSVAIQTYRTATGSGCTTSTANVVTWTINAVTAINSQSTATQSRCITFPFNAISVAATGTGTLSYQWHKNVNPSTSGGTPVGTNSNSYTPPSTEAGTLYYYCVVTGTCGTATSALSGAFTVNPPAFVPAVHHVSDLTATGENIKWYAAASGGSALAGTVVIPVGTTHYYASQTVNGLESPGRFDLTVFVDNTPCKPTGSATQTLCPGSTVAGLNATGGAGSAVRWYDVASGGTFLDPSTTLIDGHVYYATQTIDCTESTTRLAVTVVISAAGCP